MNEQDLDLEQRVWERVNGGTGVPQPRQDDRMRSLILLAEESAADFRQLARRYTGTRREQLLQFSRQTGSNADTLRGMYHLSGGENDLRPSQQPDSERRSLTKACRRCASLRRAYADYAKDDPEYGCVFTLLEQQAAHRMEGLLELIGTAIK